MLMADDSGVIQRAYDRVLGCARDPTFGGDAENAFEFSITSFDLSS